MKISYSWLKEYIDFNLSPTELSNKLTLAGLEVEDLEEKDKSDSVLEINVTPNRPDCLSLIGIAREVSALTGCPVKYPDDMVIEQGKNIEELTSVTVQDEQLCPRYSARVIQGVQVGSSPKWLIDRLNSIGIRSINNIVDITNFVLFELGHPLHAFDFDLLKEHRIVVRCGNREEQFISLDNTTCDVKDTMLVIADGERPIALAGVIGGKNTEVSGKTTNILLESAFFEPTQIRRVSKKLGIQTDSSFRFERGADPEAVLKASNRAARLILKLAGGKASKGIIDVYPSILLSPEITLRIDRVNKILGTFLSENQAKDYLEKLDFSVLQDQEGQFKVKAPSYRRDATREIDLIEEIVRLHGYDKIEVKSPEYRVNRIKVNKYNTFEKEIRNYFQGKGFCEAINYSFISNEMQNMFQSNSRDVEAENIFIRNPISMEWGVMRRSLIPGLLDALRKNLNKGISDIQLFELGRQYNTVGYTETPSKDKAIEQNKNSSSKEINFLTGIATSKVERKLWEEKGKEREIYSLKGIIEIFLENMHIKEYNFKKSCLPAFDNLIEVYATDEIKIGIIGALSRRIMEKMDIKDRIMVFEINLDILYDLWGKSITFQPLSKYPGVLRDLAVFANREIQSKEIEDFIKQKGTSLLKETTLFDCYEGKSIPLGKKSLAYSLVFRDDERTLKDEEVDTIYDNIIKGLAEKFDAHLRA